MTRLYLVRHGETEENQKSSFCGWKDPSLCAGGMKQAKNLADALKNKEIDVIYTSGLKRAIETAGIINKYHCCPVYHVEGFREINFGEAEGLTIEGIRNNYPEVYEGLEKDYIKTRFPGGESLEDMHSRVTDTVNKILDEEANKNILLVAHAGVIRSIITHLITGDIKYHWNFRIDHCSISIVEKHEDFCILTKLNDICHL